LDAGGHEMRKRFFEPDVHDAEPRKVAVLGREGAVQDLDVLDQLRRERLQRAQVALAVSLGRLVLVDVVDEHLETARDAAVIQVEAEAPNLDRLATAFVLARADAGVERVEELVVATEESLAVDGIVAALDPRLASRGDDHDTVMHLRERGRELEP